MRIIETLLTQAQTCLDNAKAQEALVRNSSNSSDVIEAALLRQNNTQIPVAEAAVLSSAYSTDPGQASTWTRGFDTQVSCDTQDPDTGDSGWDLVDETRDASTYATPKPY